MTNVLFKAVDRAPFSGKPSVTETIKKHIEAPPESEQRQFLRTEALLGVYVIGHALQAGLGSVAFRTHFESFQTTHSPIDAVGMGIDATYTIINAAVSARQAALVGRVNQNHRKKKHRRRVSGNSAQSPAPQIVIDEHDDTTQHSNQANERPNTHENTSKKAQRLLLGATALTLAGQVIFMGSYVDGLVKQPEIECSNFVTNSVQEYESANNTTISDEEIARYHDRICND